MADSVFNLARLPNYKKVFPQLKDRPKIGRGVFSIVYEGNKDTVLKFGCDPAYYSFIREKGGCEGLPKLINDFGSVEDKYGDEVFLVEIEKLKPLQKWNHDRLILQRDALISMVSYKIAESEVRSGMVPAALYQADALRGVAESCMFDWSVRSGLRELANFFELAELDITLDMANPENYMTNGTDLIITDPVMMIM